MYHNPPGSSVQETPQARMPEWVAMPFSRDLPDSGIEIASLMSSALAGMFFAPRAPLKYEVVRDKLDTGLPWGS